jgi:hypothetical protein
VLRAYAFSGREREWLGLLQLSTSHGDAHAYQYGDAYGYRHSHAHAHQYGDACGHRHGDGNVHADADVDLHADADVDLHADADVDLHADTDVDLHTDTADRHLHAHCDKHIDANEDLYTNGDVHVCSADAYPYIDAYPHIDASSAHGNVHAGTRDASPGSRWRGAAASGRCRCSVRWNVRRLRTDGRDVDCTGRRRGSSWSLWLAREVAASQQVASAASPTGRPLALLDLQRGVSAFVDGIPDRARLDAVAHLPHL